MSLGRILLIATGVELVGFAALAVAIGLAGVRSILLDTWNTFLPVWCALAVLGGVIGWFSLGRRPARTVLATVAAATVLASGAPIALEVGKAAWSAAAAPRAPRHPLRVLTFNSSGESYDGRINVRAVMLADPDIFAIQEPTRFDPYAGALAAAYPYTATCPPPLSCPLVIYSKRPILRTGHVVKHVTKQGWLDGIDLLWVETMAPDGRPVILATTHFLWPLPPGPQIAQRDKLARDIARLPRDSLILVGDFNQTPWTFALRRQDAMLRPLRRRTLALATWPAFLPRVFMPLPPLLPIDHVYAGPAWRTVRVERLARATSDHLAVLAVLARE